MALYSYGPWLAMPIKARAQLTRRPENMCRRVGAVMCRHMCSRACSRVYRHVRRHVCRHMRSHVRSRVYRRVRRHVRSRACNHVRRHVYRLRIARTARQAAANLCAPTYLRKDMCADMRRGACADVRGRAHELTAEQGYLRVARLVGLPRHRQHRPDAALLFQTIRQTKKFRRNPRAGLSTTQCARRRAAFFAAVTSSVFAMRS